MHRELSLSRRDRQGEDLINEEKHISKKELREPLLPPSCSAGSLLDSSDLHSFLFCSLH